MQKTYAIYINILLLCFLMIPQAEADITFSGDFAAGTGQVDITANFSFTVTTPLPGGQNFLLVIDGWQAYDGSATGTSPTAAQAGWLSVNGVDQGSSALFGAADHAGGNVGSLTTEDSYLNINFAAGLNIGDEVTIGPSTWNFAATPGFNPALSAAGTAPSASMFLAQTRSGVKLSDAPVVTAPPPPPDDPEPIPTLPGWALLLTGGLLMWIAVGFHRRSHRCSPQEHARTETL